MQLLTKPVSNSSWFHSPYKVNRGYSAWTSHPLCFSFVQCYETMSSAISTDTTVHGPASVAEVCCTAPPIRTQLVLGRGIRRTSGWTGQVWYFLNAPGNNQVNLTFLKSRFSKSTSAIFSYSSTVLAFFSWKTGEHSKPCRTVTGL